MDFYIFFIVLIKYFMKKAFTLVELIVVITILAILWTIAFISLSGYSADARDAKRLSDTSSLLSKINIENARGMELEELITNATWTTLQILWKEDQNVKTFWIANFENLKENRDNFMDPFYKNQDYLFAYVEWWRWSGSYSFVQSATISEKKNATIIKWNYYKSIPEDADSLFKTSTWYIFKNNDERLIYWEGWTWNQWGEEWWWEEDILTCVDPENVTDKMWFRYYEDNWEIIILEYNMFWTEETMMQWLFDAPREIVIPCEIDGMPVTQIGSFYVGGIMHPLESRAIKSLVIPNNVVSISGFIGNVIEYLSIWDGVKDIWDYAFNNNNIINDIYIWKNVESIWHMAFDWVLNLKDKTLKIPWSVKTIWNSAFSNNYYWLQNIIFEEWVESIWNYAFQMNRIKDAVILPDSINSLWEGVFARNEIKTIKIPKNITKIPKLLFFDNLIESMEIPNNIKEIWESAFEHNKLKTLEIPNGTTTIWIRSFAENYITSLIIPDSVTSIWDDAFNFQSHAEIEWMPVDSCQETPWELRLWTYALEMYKKPINIFDRLCLINPVPY